jgi:hypothetical protein
MMSVSPDNEVSMARKLRRMKRRLLLDASHQGEEDPRTNMRDEETQMELLTHMRFPSLDAPPAVCSVAAEEKNGSVTGIRKLRRIKRRLLLEQTSVASSPSTPITHHRKPPANSNSTIHADGRFMDASRAKGSLDPVISARMLHRIKRRLFLNSLNLPTSVASIDLNAGAATSWAACLDCASDSDSAMLRPNKHQKIVSQENEELPPHLWLKSWSDKVEAQRGSPPQSFSLQARPKSKDQKVQDKDIESKLSSLSLTDNMDDPSDFHLRPRVISSTH